MKPLRVSEDIVPIGEFKARAARWLKRTRETAQPVVITQNGKPAGVLLSPIEYDRLSERERFLQSVASGLADADAGRVMTTNALKTRLAARRSARRHS
jgi:prevent-host-death family protein